MILFFTLPALAVSSWEADGRLSAYVLPNFQYLYTDQTNRQNHYLRSRLLLNHHKKITQRFSFEMELELFNTQLLGEPPSSQNSLFTSSRTTHGQWHEVWPRKFLLSMTTQKSKLSFGFQPFHWGLGIWANDGKDDSWFGTSRGGDINLRLAGATLPLRRSTVSLFAFGDMVTRSDTISIYNNHRGYNALFGIHSGKENNSWGFIGGVQWQDGTKVLPFDFFFEKRFMNSWSIGNETIYIFDDKHRIGSVLQAKIQSKPFGFGADLGFTSGDFGKIGTMRLHSDHNAGILLFEQIIPLSLHDEDYSTNNGQISNSLYFHGLMQYQYRNFALRYGYLNARSVFENLQQNGIGTEQIVSFRWRKKDLFTACIEGAVFTPHEPYETVGVIWGVHTRMQFQISRESTKRQSQETPPW